MKNERYYYGIMSSEEKQAYKMIYNGLKARALNIVVSVPLLPEQIQEVYIKVLYDNPLFYYINQTIIKMSGHTGCYVLIPEYLYSDNEITLLDRDIRNIVNRIGGKAGNMLNNEFRLEKYLHDSVVKSVAYDYDSLMKNDRFNAHSIIGAFLDKKAVCEGIAKAFKLLCNEYSIKCIVVLGEADVNGNFGKDSYHAWNLVKINNDSYHVDPTWDNMYDKGFNHISYDYFNVTTKDILKDHKPFDKLPLCVSDKLNYFTCTKSQVNTYKELVRLIEKRIEHTSIMFKIAWGNEEFKTVGEIEEKIHMAVSSVMIEKNKYRKFTVLFNERQSIGKILFENRED